MFRFHLCLISFLIVSQLGASAAHADDALKIPAKRITYKNSTSGLKAKSVQTAIDETVKNVSSVQTALDSLSVTVDSLSVTVADAIRGISSSGAPSTSEDGTTWTGTVYEAKNNTIYETPLTMTFTPTSADTGTWTASPTFPFHPQTARCSQDPANEGTFSGSYRAIGNAVFAYGVSTTSNIIPFSTSAFVSVNGNTMTINPNISSCRAIVILTKQ